MKSALGFSDVTYSLGFGIFFIGYFLFEVPSNLVLARIGARVWLARILITWGLISSAMAIVRTPEQLYLLRFLLGAAEAGFFPGVIYYLSHWFPATRRASAIAQFMTAAAVSGIVGGPLSAALFRLEGVASLAGWQWIFVAEGVPSIVLGVATLWLLPDRPADAKWLSPAERDRINAMLQKDAHGSPRGHSGVREALLHPTVWRLSLLLITLDIGLYGITSWLPQILGSLVHRDKADVALLTAIPYACAAAAMICVGAHSDRHRERRLHLVIAASVGALGLIATAFAETPIIGMIAVSIATMGVFSAIPVFWSLPATFLSGVGAAAAIALINSLGNLGGFFAPNLIAAGLKATGTLAPGLMTIAAFLVVSVILAICLRSPAFAFEPTMDLSKARGSA
jgi:MFS family permease